MKLLKQISILSIFLMAMTPSAVAMQGWFTPGRTLVGIGTALAAGAALLNRMSPETREQLVNSNIGRSAIAASTFFGTVASAWGLKGLIFGNDEDEGPDGLAPLTEEELSFLAITGTNVEERAEWQQKLFALLKTTYKTQSKETLKAQMLKVKDAYILLAPNTLAQINKAGQLKGLRSVLRLYTASVIQTKTAEFEGTLKKNQDDVKKALETNSLLNLLTENELKAKLSENQVERIEALAKFIATCEDILKELNNLIKAAQ